MKAEVGDSNLDDLRRDGQTSPGPLATGAWEYSLLWKYNATGEDSVISCCRPTQCPICSGEAWCSSVQGKCLFPVYRSFMCVCFVYVCVEGYFFAEHKKRVFLNSHNLNNLRLGWNSGKHISPWTQSYFYFCSSFPANKRFLFLLSANLRNIFF